MSYQTTNNLFVCCIIILLLLFTIAIDIQHTSITVLEKHVVVLKQRIQSQQEFILLTNQRINQGNENAANIHR